jgi:hypothetical protein
MSRLTAAKRIAAQLLCKSPLYFQQLTNCSFAKSFPLIFIQTAPGGGVVVLVSRTKSLFPDHRVLRSSRYLPPNHIVVSHYKITLMESYRCTKTYGRPPRCAPAIPSVDCHPRAESRYQSPITRSPVTESQSQITNHPFVPGGSDMLGSRCGDQARPRPTPFWLHAWTICPSRSLPVPPAGASHRKRPRPGLSQPLCGCARVDRLRFNQPLDGRT